VIDLFNLAVDMPELDEPGQNGLLRKRWFPMVICSPSLLHVILLISASHYAARLNTTRFSLQLLQIKQTALSRVNNAIGELEGLPADPLIGAVAKLASYEAIYGDRSMYQAHMKGLREMVELRGGLGELGLGGLLSRMLLWIDTNSSFILGTRLNFREAKLPIERPQLAPTHFIGES
jgi:hypothetical protein